MAKNGRKKPSLVEVEWLDAITYPVEHKIGDVLRECPLGARCTSGYLLHEKTDDGRTILAHTIDWNATNQEFDGADFTVIPSGWVTDIKHVRRPRGQKRKAKTTTTQPAAPNTESLADTRSSGSDEGGTDKGTSGA